MLKNYPDFVEIRGEKYYFNTDFSNWIKILQAGDDLQLNDEEQIAIQLRLAYRDYEKIRPEIVKNFADFWQSLHWFLRCGKAEADGSNAPQTYDFEQDWDYIAAAFEAQYGKNLDEIRAHWWWFISRFNALDSESQFMKIVGYRAMNLSDISDKKRRGQYAKLKQQYALKSKWEDYENAKADDEVERIIARAQRKAEERKHG